VAAAQDLTAAFADCGPEIAMSGYNRLGVWLHIDINDSENVRIKALAKRASGGADEYEIAVMTKNSDLITADNNAYTEFVNDEDQTVFIEFEVGNMVPYVQLQVSTGVVGASAGQIDDAYISRAWVPAGDTWKQRDFNLDGAFDSVADNVHIVEDNPLSSQFVSVTHVDDTNQTDAWSNYYIDMDNYKNLGIQFSFSCDAGAVDGYVYASLQSDGTAPADCFYTDMTNDLTGSDSVRAVPGTDANDIIFIDTSQPIKYIRVQTGNDTADTADITIYSKKQY